MTRSVPPPTNNGRIWRMALPVTRAQSINTVAKMSRAPRATNVPAPVRHFFDPERRFFFKSPRVFGNTQHLDL